MLGLASPACPNTWVVICPCSALALPLKWLLCMTFFQAFPNSSHSPVAKNGMCIYRAEIKVPSCPDVASLIPNEKTGFKLAGLLFWAMQRPGETYFCLLAETADTCCHSSWVHLLPSPCSSVVTAHGRRERRGHGQENLLGTDLTSDTTRNKQPCWVGAGLGS